MHRRRVAQIIIMMMKQEGIIPYWLYIVAQTIRSTTLWQLLIFPPAALSWLIHGID